MEKLDTNELIEQYLHGLLPAEEQQAVEVRIATDPVFRADVQLHRQLQEEFEDPKKLQLRDLLADITREPPPTPYRWVKWMIILLAGILAVWLVWYQFSPTQPTLPVQEEMKSVPPVIAPDVKKPSSDTVQNKRTRSIVMADPAAFAPNRAFEDRLGSHLRDLNGTAEMQSPAMGARFMPVKGFVKINFRGTTPAGSDTTQFPLILNIYTNRTTSSQPLLQILPIIRNRYTSSEKWNFSVEQQLRLKPGLYYFTIEHQADEDLIFVGKFSVGALQN